jgi:hypothetical protein
MEIGHFPTPIDGGHIFTTVPAALFEMRQLVAARYAANVWEPREIRGRLRHCDRLQTPNATGPFQYGREGGSED